MGWFLLAMLHVSVKGIVAELSVAKRLVKMTKEADIDSNPKGEGEDSNPKKCV